MGHLRIQLWESDRKLNKMKLEHPSLTHDTVNWRMCEVYVKECFIHVALQPQSIKQQKGHRLHHHNCFCAHSHVSSVKTLNPYLLI